MRHAPAPPPAKTPEILLVDDNRQGLIARKSLLQELGYNIFTATSGDEALELLSKHNFDVVVTDFKMPRMDGVELIKRIRSAQASARIILLSGFVEPLGLTEQSTGADVVIVKSAGEVGQLTRSVKRLLSEPPARKPAGSAPAPGRALVGAQPQVAVRGLRDGADGVLRQAALLRPYGARILCQALARIERERAGRQPGRQRQHRSNALSHRSQYKTRAAKR